MNKQPDSYEDTSGLIFDIIKYAIHDGPGIRTTALRVVRSVVVGVITRKLEQYTELMYRLHCTHCGQCIEICPQHALESKTTVS